MSDMLVKMYTLPELAPSLDRVRQLGIEIRQAAPPERSIISGWVSDHFEESWAVACDVALLRHPVSCYLAVKQDATHVPSQDPYDVPSEVLLGFACFDVDVKGMFGPMGVREDQRCRGIGTALLLACLHAMRAERYAYAVIGWAGPTEFHAKTVGATEINGSEPGIFRGRLRV
jgi:GNAT superfamily N-acetyltransferase